MMKRNENLDTALRRPFWESVRCGAGRRGFIEALKCHPDIERQPIPKKSEFFFMRRMLQHDLDVGRSALQSPVGGLRAEASSRGDFTCVRHG